MSVLPLRRLVGAAVVVFAAVSYGWTQEHGTAFALLRTPEAIYVAADSKLTWFDTTGAVGTTCKIRRVGPTWYVLGGIYQLPASGYNAPALAGLALRTTGTVAEKARDFETRAVPALSELMETVSNDRDQTKDWGEVATIPLTIFVFGFENGKPAVSSREFQRSTTSAGEPTIKVQRGDYGPGTRENVWLASPSSLAGGFVSEVPDWQSMEPASMVKAFVEFAIRKRPNTTGGSIDVIRLDRSGHRWLRRKTECMD